MKKKYTTTEAIEIVVSDEKEKGTTGNAEYQKAVKYKNRNKSGNLGLTAATNLLESKGFKKIIFWIRE